MVWALAVVSLIGMVLGAIFSAPALIVASVLIVVAGCLAAAFAVVPATSLALFVLCAVAALQASYLMGLFLGFWVRSTRARFSRPSRGSSRC